MGTTLATKQDLEVLRRDTENRFALVEQKIDGIESRLEQRIEDVEKSLKQTIDSLESKLGLKIDALELRMTVKLGSLLMLGFGLAIAALRLWA